MNELDLHPKVPRKKYKSYHGDVGKVAPNVLMRDFKSEKPLQKWTTDVSEFAIASGKLYLSPILDMFNGEIISYDISTSATFYQTMHMLDLAFEKYDSLDGLIMHSDQGWQYQQNRYQHRLKQRGIIQSMSRKGNCLDNAMMENFFGLIKNEIFYGKEQTFTSIDDLELAITQYIDYYNNQRIKLRLNGLSPVQYRLKFENQ